MVYTPICRSTKIQDQCLKLAFYFAIDILKMYTMTRVRKEQNHSHVQDHLLFGTNFLSPKRYFSFCNHGLKIENLRVLKMSGAKNQELDGLASGPTDGLSRHPGGEGRLPFRKAPISSLLSTERET